MPRPSAGSPPRATATRPTATWSPGIPRRHGPDELLLRLRQELDDAHSEAKVKLVRVTAGGARDQLLRGRGKEGAESAVRAGRHRGEPRLAPQRRLEVAGGGGCELRERDGAGLSGHVLCGEVHLVTPAGHGGECGD